MLSAESAAGQYPVEAVATMNRIAEEVERDPLYRTIIHAQRTDPEATGADAIAAAAREIAETLELSAIICWTSSGSTGLRVARERPKSPIVAISPKLSTGRRLSLVWGVHCIVAEDAHDLDDMVERACRLAFKDGFAKAGQRVIIVAGVPLGTPGATNMLRIAFVGATGGSARPGRIRPCRRSQISRPSTLSVSFLTRSGMRSSLRMDGERAAEDVERALVVAEFLQDDSEPGERAEMARLARQHLLDIGERAAEVLLGVVERGAPVPGLDEIGLDVDDRVEQLDREIDSPCRRPQS